MDNEHLLANNTFQLKEKENNNKNANNKLYNTQNLLGTEVYYAVRKYNMWK